MYYAKKQNDKIIGYVESSTHPEGYEPASLQEIQEYEQSLLSVFVSIKIPLAHFLPEEKRPDLDTDAKKAQATAIRDKVRLLHNTAVTNFSDIHFSVSDDMQWKVYTGINLKHLPLFLTKADHDSLVAIGTVMDDKITALYSDTDTDAS